MKDGEAACFDRGRYWSKIKIEMLVEFRRRFSILELVTWRTYSEDEGALGVEVAEKVWVLEDFLVAGLWFLVSSLFHEVVSFGYDSNDAQRMADYDCILRSMSDFFKDEGHP